MSFTIGIAGNGWALAAVDQRFTQPDGTTNDWGGKMISGRHGWAAATGPAVMSVHTLDKLRGVDFRDLTETRRIAREALRTWGGTVTGANPPGKGIHTVARIAPEGPLVSVVWFNGDLAGESDLAVPHPPGMSERAFAALYPKIAAACKRYRQDWRRMARATGRIFEEASQAGTTISPTMEVGIVRRGSEGSELLHWCGSATDLGTMHPDRIADTFGPPPLASLWPWEAKCREREAEHLHTQTRQTA